jgi:hypothetical protein
VDTQDDDDDRASIQVRLDGAQLRELDAYVADAGKRIGKISRATAIRYLLEYALKEKRRTR